LKLVFKNNNNLTRAIWLYKSFGSPSSLTSAARYYPAIFGKQFYNTAKINYDINSLANRYRTLFAFLFSEKMDDNTKVKCQKIIKRLEKTIYMPKENSSVEEIRDKLSGVYHSKEGKIKKEFKNIFDFNLPDQLFVVLTGALYHDDQLSGSGLYSNSKNLAISLEVSYENKSKDYIQTALSVLLHELLHILIQKNNKLTYNSGDYFEEALIDYFVPHGIISRNLGIEKRDTINDYFEYNAKVRPYAKEISEKLLPILEEYNKMNNKENIWNFLKKKGLSKYIKS
jgi:hypothetical protein